MDPEVKTPRGALGAENGGGLKPSDFSAGWVKTLVDSISFGPGIRYCVAGAVMAAQLLALHLWLVAGKRRVMDVLPGILLTIVLWLALAGLWLWR